MGSRKQNEHKFSSWVEHPDGGRTYSRTVQGKSGWVATYHKQVSASEQTLAFWQEIYDASGRLVEIHEKFPVDKGHRKV
ncbi:MAG: hypothetical protein JJU29_17780 [Verrucomicrobia bacterium]|nr:hypothetical protein [Verrucomicrobiota bacterium]